ncbi:hypothetical protein AOQ84DRAFT_229435 [Glonium stellatum]|uniref:Nephrocystin 3-like N-terminal domain-containing protein n=1 Tax=Glonium stellatum TaxID=574774 RepID=A0A8E2JM57_9PEZI|nr:hypothetical protein AOQ84DRAFT_229435 [Glonium stellatum]
MSESLDAKYRNGMNEVHTPPRDVGGSRNSSSLVANIVFVHGLFGHPWKTWADGAVKEPKKPFWPKDLLPDTLKNVRIFSFGYDADIGKFMSPASKNSVQDHGANLLNDLSFLIERKEEKSVPFIFVAHSLGGLVLKEKKSKHIQALNQSSTARDHRKRVVESTHGIIFLGTPHRGSDAASYGKIAFTLTKVFASQNANTKLLRALEKSSEVLERITKSFYETWNQHDEMQIYSFHEEKDVTKLGIFHMRIVSPECAKIGHVNELTGSIPEDHMHIAKFRGPSDPGFVRIRNVLINWAGEIEDNKRNCLKSLNKPDARARIRQVSPHHKDSFDWLFTDQVSFGEWLADDEERFSPIFWITGKPGSGKSTIMRFAMQDDRLLNLVPEGKGKPIGYFFHLRGKDIVQKSLHGMLRELVYQLLSQFPDYFQCIKSLYQDLVLESHSRKPEWDVTNLKQCLLSLSEMPIESQARNRFILFIDALDENQDSQENNEAVAIVKQLVELFAQRKEKTPGNVLKICLASRPWPIFQKALGNDPRIPRFAINEFTKRDIENYTSQHLTSVMSEVNESWGSSVEQLVEIVGKKAHGVFMWVRIVVQNLCQAIVDGGSFADLEDYLAKLPEELDRLYQDIVTRIKPSYALEALVCCRIILFSQTRFTLNSLHRATKTCIHGTFDASNWTTQQQLAWLKSRTGGLIDVVESVGDTDSPFVQLIHQTAQEFVRSGLMGLSKTTFEPFWLDLDGNYLIYTAFLNNSSLEREVSPADGNIDPFNYLRALDAALDEDAHHEDPKSSKKPLYSAIQKHLAKEAERRSERALSRLEKSEELLELKIGFKQQLDATPISTGPRSLSQFIGDPSLLGCLALEQLESLLAESRSAEQRQPVPYQLRRRYQVEKKRLHLAQHLRVIVEDLHNSIFWQPHSEVIERQQQCVLLFVAALGPRAPASQGTDRPRMVTRILERFSSDLVGSALMIDPTSKNASRFNEIIGQCNAHVRSNMGESLLITLILIDEHPLVDEDMRLRIAHVLLSHGAPLELIKVQGSKGELHSMSPLHFALRFKSKKWSDLLLRHNAKFTKEESAASMDMLSFRDFTLPGIELAKDSLYRNLDTETDESSYPGWLLGGIVGGSIGCPNVGKAFVNASRRSTGN